MVPVDFVESTNEMRKPVASIQISHKINISERGRILGENTQLASISSNMPERTYIAIKLDIVTALNAQRGFMPFSSDPVKDARYRQFLAHFASPNTTELPNRLLRQSNSDYQKELEEFVKAANIFKPLPSMMASRFTTGTKNSIPTVDTTPRAGLHLPTKMEPPTLKDQPREELDEVVKIPISGPREKLPYGMETRSELEWIPTSMLCKRFEIEPPAKTIEASQKSVKPVLSMQAVKEIVSESSFVDKVDLANLPDDANPEDDKIVTEDQGSGSYEDLVKERPDMDLFRSIFGDDNHKDADPGSQPILFASQISTFEDGGSSFTNEQHQPIYIPLSPVLLPSTLDLQTQDIAHKVSNTMSEPPALPWATAESEDSTTDQGAGDDSLIIKEKKRPAAADLW